MKKKIVFMIAVVLALTVFTGTIAYAGNGNGSGGSETQGTAQDRSQYMEQIREQVEEVYANRAQIAALNAQLVQLRDQTREHLQEMCDNPDAVTDGQIAAAQSITAEIKAVREQLVATNTEMRQHRQTLRSMRQSRNYEGIIEAYGDVLRIQEQRITMLQQLVQLHEQACNL